MIQWGFKVVWSKNWLLIPLYRTTHEGKSIGYTNKFKNYTYRLKPYIKFTRNHVHNSK